MDKRVDILKLGELNAHAIEMGFRYATPGIVLSDLDETIGKYIVGTGCKPAFLGYQGFPANCCLSVNDQLVHGIGKGYVLQDGDMLTIDCGVQYESSIVDSADTRVIGTPSVSQQRLMNAGKDILAKCMGQIKNNVSLYSIMRAGFNRSLELDVFIFPDFGGHTIEPDKLHGIFIPHAPDYRLSDSVLRTLFHEWQTTRLRTGDIICLEPVVCAKKTDTIQDEDGWTVRTSDGQLAVHYEHCMRVTNNGYEVIC